MRILPIERVEGGYSFIKEGLVFERMVYDAITTIDGKPQIALN